MILSLAGMSGIAPKITPELLPDNVAQVATNVKLQNGGVKSLKTPVTVATPTKSGIAKTIHRFGRNAGEALYWLKFTNHVSVALGPIAGDTEERTYYTGDTTPRKTKFDMATQSGTDYPMAYYELGVPAPTLAPSTTTVAGTGPVVNEQRAYVYTNVTAWGEESAPSPATIVGVTSTTVARLSGFSAVPTGAYNITKRYIYRSVTSSTGTNYYFVGEISSAATEFDDTTDIALVGDPLATLDWDEPPSDLSGLVALPSGAMCGFSGKEVCFSVIGAPYAWPAKYRLTCNYNISAVAPMGQGIVVLTDGYPYFINTGEPESAQMIRLDEEQACVSARSVVAVGGSVMYASPDGLVGISSGGANVLTKDLYDRDAWQALGPESIHAYKHDGRYYGFFTSGGFILDQSGALTPHDITATAGYVDPVLDKLYIMVGQDVQKWDSGSLKTHTWKSKRWNLPKPMAFSAAQIKANSFDNLTFKIYYSVDPSISLSISGAGWSLVITAGSAVFTKAVTSAEPFRVPSGYKSRLYEIELSGTDHWTFAFLAQSMTELNNV